MRTSSTRYNVRRLCALTVAMRCSRTVLADGSTHQMLWGRAAGDCRQQNTPRPTWPAGCSKAGGQPPLGSWASVAGYLSMKDFRASPLTEPQNWRWPKASVELALLPDQWAKARFLPSGQGLPSSALKGAAMNLPREDSGSLALEICSIWSICSLGSVSRYQRIV